MENTIEIEEQAVPMYHIAYIKDGHEVFKCGIGPVPVDWLRDNGIEEWREVDPCAPVEPSIDNIIQEYMDMVQARLDNFARSGGKAYDNMLSACTYATSTNPVFKAEAQYCVEKRDETWDAAHKFLNEMLPLVMAGERGIPTWEEVEAVLPVLQWPEVSNEAAE